MERTNCFESLGSVRCRSTRRGQFCLLSVLFILAATSVGRAQTCQLGFAIDSLKGQRPIEIDPTVPPGTCGFLQFAWQDFLALDWPPLPIDPNNIGAQARGLPDPTKVVGQGGNSDQTVWEQSQPNWYLFWPNNPPPQSAGGDSFAAWNQYSWLPAACGPLRTKLPPGSPPPRILSSLSKFDAMPGVSQAFSAPLIDQEGYYVRYEILMDYQAFNYINSNEFYLLSQLQAFATKGQPFTFPVQSANMPGATFLKVAWKVLSEQEINSGRFHTAQAFLYTPAAPNIEPTCAGPVTVGLVGLHIVQKTQQFPQWMWATFEQVDTTPADPNQPGANPPEGWGFFKNGSSKTANQKPLCPDGTTPSTACDFQPTSSHLGTNPNDKTGGPTQAVRMNPIPSSPNQPALGQINAAAQAALKQINPSTEWQFYQLVEAQWQQAKSFFPPGKVANMTMETYTQNGSCMGCHTPATAPFKGSPAVSSDLTFELTLAWQPQALPAARVPALVGNAAKRSSSKKAGNARSEGDAK
jgi:hypothetical protein